MNFLNGDVDHGRRKALLGGAALVGLTSTGTLTACGTSSTASSSNSGGGTAGGGSGYDGTIQVTGSTFSNGSGTSVQLRGASIQNYALAMILGSTDASGGVTGGNDQAHGPNLSVLSKWKMNAIRIGINEASWLGYECYTTHANGDGVTGWINPSPASGASSYRQQIIDQIAALNSIGCYAVLTLAYSNPGRSAPLGQDFMANQDNSIACWQSIAQTLGYPNGTALKKNGGTVDDRSVLFELYNEPAMYGEDAVNWGMLMNGGFYGHGYYANYYGALGLPFTSVFPFPCTAPAGPGFIPGEIVTVGGNTVGQILCYYQNSTQGLPSSGSRFLHIYNQASSNAPYIASGSTVTGSISGTTAVVTGAYGWFVAGHSQMLSAIRATGAWNPCLLSGDQYNQDLSGWAAYAPSDATPPAAYGGPGWTPQIAACWHPYPSSSYISGAAVASGGSGYSVGDTILLPMPEAGPAANSVYWQAQLKVTAVSGTSVSAVQINPYTGGTPGLAGGNAGQFSSHQSGQGLLGGAYCNLFLPPGPVPQESSSGRGTGASFKLSFTDTRGNGWPNQVFWRQVVDLKRSRNVPVVVTEAGEHYGKGVSGSPWMAALTSWCDANDISLIGYAYTPSDGWIDLNGGDFGVIDGDDRPTPGYGAFMYAWFTGHGP